jgi:predicted AlkP superfamily pyrophosphatase or phosphodiesterase
MTVVVLGLDALDPDLLDEDDFPDLCLAGYKEIETVLSSETGRPSTHELWPTIITGLRPEEHGLQLESGLTWENPLFNLGSDLSNYVLPKEVQVKLGAWLLDNTDEGNFRAPATYYENNGLATVFDGAVSKPIGVPNYVVDPDEEDREHELRKNLGNLFRLDVNDETDHRHVTSDPGEFYEQAMEMSMIRIARVRRALRSKHYELVFGYTSGLDLIGHVAYAEPGLQRRAYEELDDFVGELRDDLRDGDELLLVSDHGLQEGEHTEEAAVSSTSEALIREIESVLDVKGAIEAELRRNDHEPTGKEPMQPIGAGERGQEVREHLEDLGYM